MPDLRDKKFVIIGGGIGGLALANLLAKDGADVHVYEKNAELGGRAGELKEAGFTFDTGPSWYLMPEVFDRYWHEFGRDVQADLAIARLDPSYKVFYEHNEPLTVTGDIDRDAVTFESVEAGAGDALRRYARESKRLYDLALSYFLYTDFRHLTGLLKPGIILRTPALLRYMLTPVHTHVARFVHSQRLQQILEYPMVFLGTSPYQAPALYSLMGALDFDQGVFYPKNGIRAVIDGLLAIGRGLGVTYNTQVPVVHIETEGGRAVAVVLKNGERIAADVIVSNADIHHTETALLAPADRYFSQSYWNRRQPSCSALLIYLGIKGPTPNLEHHNLLFVDAWKENFDALYTAKEIPEKASLYVSRTSATSPGVAPDGHEALFVLVPLPAGLSLTSEREKELAAHYVSQIENMTGESLHGRIVYQKTFGPKDFGSLYNSWQNSMLGQSHLLKQSAFWRTPNRSKKLANLYYVGGNTLPGVGLPMCLISAQVVARRIIEERR